MLQLATLVLMNALTAAVRSQTLAPMDRDLKPNITCCNGARPFVETSIWQADWSAFKELPGNGSSPKCINYELRISNKMLAKKLKKGGALVCKCTGDHYGASCELTRQAQTMSSGGDGQSFKMFLLLAVIPLTFALLAAVGGFFCRMCCCHIIGFECFNHSWRFGGNKRSDGVHEAFGPQPRGPRPQSPHSAEPPNDSTPRHQWITVSQDYLPDPIYCGPPPSYETVVRQCESTTAPAR